MPCSLPLDSVRVKSGARGICRDFFPIDTTAFRCLKSMKPCEVEAGGDTRCYSFWTILLSVMYKWNIKHPRLALIHQKQNSVVDWLWESFSSNFATKNATQVGENHQPLRPLRPTSPPMRSPGRSEELQAGDFPQNGRYGEPFNKEIFRSCFLVLLLVVVFFRHEKLSFFEGKSLKRDGCWLVR